VVPFGGKHRTLDFALDKRVNPRYVVAGLRPNNAYSLVQICSDSDIIHAHALEYVLVLAGNHINKLDYAIILDSSVALASMGAEGTSE